MRVIVAFALILPAFAGCLTTAQPASSIDAAGFPACEHPWPCADGSEWPPGLTGPFDVGEPEAVRIPVLDGVELEAYVWRPVLPDGVRAPVVMHAQPYASQCYLGAVCFPRGDDPFWLDEFALRPIVEAGIAVANVNVRGTGTSGGCFDFNGPREANDLAAAVEWLAGQSWSNGRVGMTGISYMGTTPWIAANLNPPSLKTIVPGGIVTDEYTYRFTVQGAGYWPVGASEAAFIAGLGAYPPLGAPASLRAWLDVAPERACPEFADLLTIAVVDQLADERHADFFAARAHVMGFPNLTASVFVYHGFLDNSGHKFQEDEVWGTLDRAPKRMILGHWEHVTPRGLLDGYPGGEDWGEVLTSWLDFWLKGIGRPDRLGIVDYEDENGAWRVAHAWPPKLADDEDVRDEGLKPTKRRDEVLYLAAGALPTTPTPTDAASFIAVTAGGDGTTPYCGPPGAIAVFETPPLGDGVVLAGNPHAYLLLESDGAAGVVSVDVYALGPDAFCAGGLLFGGDWLTGGAADLRFHAGNLAAADFPVGTPTHVRVDLINVAWSVEPGERVAVVLSGYGHKQKLAAPAYPTLEVHATDGPEASHVVLPLVEGTLGGTAPTVAYPHRPFLP